MALILSFPTSSIAWCKQVMWLKITFRQQCSRWLKLGLMRAFRGQTLSISGPDPGLELCRLHGVGSSSGAPCLQSLFTAGERSRIQPQELGSNLDMSPLSRYCQITAQPTAAQSFSPFLVLAVNSGPSKVVAFMFGDQSLSIWSEWLGMPEAGHTERYLCLLFYQANSLWGP